MHVTLSIRSQAAARLAEAGWHIISREDGRYTIDDDIDIFDVHAAAAGIPDDDVWSVRVSGKKCYAGYLDGRYVLETGMAFANVIDRGVPFSGRPDVTVEAHASSIRDVRQLLSDMMRGEVTSLRFP